MPDFQAFTWKYNEGISRALVTECGVCQAFDPLISTAQPETIKYLALWDTGATGTVITKNIVEKLQLKPISKTKVFHANGESIVNVYAINVFLPNHVQVKFVQVTEGILNGFDLLIGMDIITLGDFSITNFGGKTCFSFRIPSVRETDYVKESHGVKSIISQSQKVGRNELCPCGSGKKYKHCHGKSA